MQQKEAKALFKKSACIRAMGMGAMHGGMMGQEGMMGGHMMKQMTGQGGAETEGESP